MNDLAHDARAHAFAVNRKRNEDSFTFSSSDAFAAESHVFD